ncbi:MAG: HNH endonuclease [Candidatus Acidiferrales bacterium]
MSTYLLTWNPAKWTFADWPQALANMAEQGFYIRQWSCVNSHAASGDKILLKKTGRGLTGIMACGTVLSAPYKNRHWNGKDNGKQFVQVRFDRLTNYTKGEIFPVKDREDFGFIPQASGCLLNEDKAANLMERFHAYAAAPVIAPKIIVLPSERNRLHVSTRVRYQILDRDAHTCLCCGRSAPDVILHVDHKISQHDWKARFGTLLGIQIINGDKYNGVNDTRNLETKCEKCNWGKGKRSELYREP